MMKLKTIVAAVCMVLCVGMAMSVTVFAEEANPVENETSIQGVTVLSDGLKYGLKSGLKNGEKR